MAPLMSSCYTRTPNVVLFKYHAQVPYPNLQYEMDPPPPNLYVLIIDLTHTQHA